MCDARIVPNVITHTEFDNVSLSFYTDEEIKQLSVQKIYNPIVFDSLLYPLPGGPHDYALGPLESNESCVTCGLTSAFCPGHFGHIQLPLIVYNPVTFNLLYKLLKKSCYVCHHFLFKSPLDALLLEGKLRLATAGFLPEAIQLEELVNSEEIKEYDPSDIQEAIDAVLADKIGDTDTACTERETRHVKQYKNSLINELLKSTSASTTCKHCGAPLRVVRQDFNSKFSLMPLSGRKVKRYLEAWKTARNPDNQLGNESQEEEFKSRADIDVKWCTTNVLLTPLEVREHIQLLWQLENSLIIALFNGYSKYNTDPNFDHNVLFISVLPVPPSNCRPMAHYNGNSYEGPQTSNIKNILLRVAEMQKAMKDLKEKQDKTTKDYEQFQHTWGQLQNAVNGFIDSDSSYIKTQKISTGIRQMLEHKQGLFRQHMMGKRVDYSARSVISPDLNINVDEIGIPLVFATTLTFPEPVTPWNVKQLRQAIVNGPLVHPGATHVEDSDGTRVLLNAKSQSQRESIARQLVTPSTLGRVQGAKKVHRHLKDGDVLLVNRQPTLHRPSIMAHKARILSDEKTLRLHYANCKAYNADFDGDEMNIHLPQDQISRSEAINLVATPHQYLTPKDGSPISGLIQDHVIGGVLLTMRGRMVNVHTYHQLVYSALPEFNQRFILLPPCQIKPKMLWSGKQVISTVLRNVIPNNEILLSMHGKTKSGSLQWAQERFMSENEVIIRNGELLCGVLDKSQFGSSQFGLVHACHELYGSGVSSKLLSAFARLFTVFLQHIGFTMGIEDILLTEEGEKLRNSILSKAEGAGITAARELFSSETDDEETLREKYRQLQNTGGTAAKARADIIFKKHANLINNELYNKLNTMHLKPFPSNALHLMVDAGAKGSAVNRLQISALLGQIELEGSRPTLMVSGRSLPSHLPYDISLKAGGFVTGRFLTGISPQEYYFHCMAGREGLIDTAVKTSRSGYLQRCLVKHLEGLKVNYDLTVRDSDGSVIQFLYGEDGISPERCAYLNPEQFKFIRDNMQAMNRRLLMDIAVPRLKPGVARGYNEKITTKVNKRARKLNCTASDFLLNKSGNATPFLNYYSKCSDEFRIDSGQDLMMPEFNHRRLWQLAAVDHWYRLTDEEMERYGKYTETCYDTVQSVFQPDLHIGSISEKMDSLINNYFATEFHSDSTDVSADEFRTCLELKYMNSLCQPGDAVGLLAAQSIGEPSTQMTLNTFHFAGRGEMNVTLGIPRLREIIMTASGKISTPCVKVPLLKGLSMAAAEEVERSLRKITVEEVLDKFEVFDSIASNETNTRYRKVKLKLYLLSKKYLKSTFGISLKRVLSYIENKFIRIIITTLTRMVKNQHDTVSKVKVDKIIDENKESDVQDDDEGDTKANKDEQVRDSMLERVESSDSGGELEKEEIRSSAKERQYAKYEDDGEGSGSQSGSDGEMEQKQRENEDDNVTCMEEEDSLLTTLSSVSIQGQDNITDRAKRVLGAFPQVKKYSYDQHKYSWCEITFQLPISTCFIMIMPIFKNLVTRCVIRQADGIKRAFINEENGEIFITTEGANIKELWKHHSTLDLNRLYSNDIVLLANTYGIEAATRAISKELSSVFKMYGINIDPRHLNLIADYQTVDGRFRGCNRISMECNASPFQQMSFETPMKFLKDSLIGRMTEFLESPSANIMSGQLVKAGTGCFDIIQKLF